VGAALLQGCAIRAPKDHLEPELPEPDKAPYQDGKKNDQAQDDAAPSSTSHGNVGHQHPRQQTLQAHARTPFWYLVQGDAGLMPDLAFFLHPYVKQTP